MKNLTILLLLLLSLACKKNTVENINTDKQLVKIVVKGKTNQTFEYSNALLIKENSFSFCETNPTDEFAYEYKSGKLSKLKKTLRSMYSSLTALCDPASGMRSDESFEYNNKGKISKIMRDNSYTEFIYNAKGLVEKQIVYSGQKTLETSFKYDNKGNLIEETDNNGAIAQYQYDDKINPFYVMNQRPGWISPFNKSPNNVIKATGRYNFIRTFKYTSDGLPSELLEDNGLTYVYIYM